MNLLISPGAMGLCFRSTMWMVTRRSLKKRSAARVTTEEDQWAETRIDLAGKIFLVHQFGLALEASARRGVGLSLGGPLRQQPPQLLGAEGDLLFDETKISFRVLLDGFQARLQVLAPSLDFGVGKLGFANAGSGRSGGDGRSGGVEDPVSQALRGLAFGLAGLADFDVGSA